MEEVEAELKIINISTNRTFTFLTCFLSIKTDKITHLFPSHLLFSQHQNTLLVIKKKNYYYSKNKKKSIQCITPQKKTHTNQRKTVKKNEGQYINQPIENPKQKPFSFEKYNITGLKFPVFFYFTLLLSQHPKRDPEQKSFLFFKQQLEQKLLNKTKD